MDAIFSVIDVSAIGADAYTALAAVIVISLVVSAAFLIGRLIFPNQGVGSDD